MPDLLIYHGSHGILREPITSSLSLGSDDSCDIILTESVARRHARIEIDDSRDGTAVVLTLQEGSAVINGSPLVGSASLKVGDTFEIGGYRCQLIDSRPSPAHTAISKTRTISEDGSDAQEHVMPVLYFMTPTVKKRFRRPLILVGRDRGNDYAIPDDFVSGKHAEIFSHHGRFRIRDLHSKNGTFVNDKRITEIELPETGNIRFGRHSILYEIQTPQTAPDEELVAISLPGIDAKGEPIKIIGKSSAFRKVMKQLTDIVNLKDSVLLLGETGVGKDVFARYLHYGNDTRKNGPFVSVNCASIPPGVADSLLFGHVRGAFTGAVKEQEGYFKQADGGTLFLDEISTLPVESQAKLLRVIEDGHVQPVGSNRSSRVDIRLVAATNRPVKADCQEGLFREDLFERFDWTVTIPPLRDRADDIPLLARYMVRLLAPSPLTITDDTLNYLKRLQWPGNIRALKKMIRQAVTRAIMRESTEISPLDLENVSLEMVQSHDDLPYAAVYDAKKKLLIESLVLHKGKVARVAASLNITRQTVYNWIEEMGINVKKLKG